MHATGSAPGVEVGVEKYLFGRQHFTLTLTFFLSHLPSLFLYYSTFLFPFLSLDFPLLSFIILIHIPIFAGRFLSLASVVCGLSCGADLAGTYLPQRLERIRSKPLFLARLRAVLQTDHVRLTR